MDYRQRQALYRSLPPNLRTKLPPVFRERLDRGLQLGVREMAAMVFGITADTRIQPEEIGTFDAVLQLPEALFDIPEPAHLRHPNNLRLVHQVWTALRDLSFAVDALPVGISSFHSPPEVLVSHQDGGERYSRLLCFVTPGEVFPQDDVLRFSFGLPAKTQVAVEVPIRAGAWVADFFRSDVPAALGGYGRGAPSWPFAARTPWDQLPSPERTYALGFDRVPGVTFPAYKSDGLRFG